MATRSNPTIAHRQLMMVLRDLRKQAELKGTQGAALAGLDPASVSRYETGKRRPHPNQVRSVLKAYGCPPEVVEAVADMALAAQSPGWWQKYRKGMPSWFDTFIGLEGAASCMRRYDAQTFPGIFQTADYYRAIIAASPIPVSPEECDRMVELRLDRQSILDQDDPPEILVVIDQVVLERPIGGAHVMSTQIKKVIDLAQSPTVRVQILPTKHGAHAGLDGPFVIFGFPTPQRFQHLTPGSVVYNQGMRGALFLEDMEDLAAYERAFDALTAAADSPEDSLQTMHRMAAAMAA